MFVTRLRIPRALFCVVASGAVVLLSACYAGGSTAPKAMLSAASAPAGSASTVAAASSANAPWYPSLEAFEHYDSGRSHVFPLARFGGSFRGPNTVSLFPSTQGAYPSGYNMAYLNANAAFIQGGSYGNLPGSIGPFVAKVNQQKLTPIWYTQLRNTQQAGEWDYPGGMAIENNGYMYVMSGYRLYKVDPANGKVVQTLVLPTKVHMRTNYPDTPPTYSKKLTQDAVNTSYNGLNALPDGTIILKSLYRTADCTTNGPEALLTCPHSDDVPQSVLLSVNPKTMKIIDNITLPAFAGARPTITEYHGVDYVYLLEKISNAVRYSVHNGFFKLDRRWTPKAVPFPGQAIGASLIVFNNWILGTTNSVPARGRLTVFAINQGDARKVLYLQPYRHDKIPPVLKLAFAQAANGKQAHSWAGMSLEADPQNGLFYGVETLARKIAAFKITGSRIVTVWTKNQTTTEWATLIGPQDHRVWVGTDIPVTEIPGKNTTDKVVFRDAATGRELARSATVPAMTQGSAIQPDYGGSVFFPSGNGTLIKVTPAPK